jgi:hypothetical protein
MLAQVAVGEQINGKGKFEDFLTFISSIFSGRTINKSTCGSKGREMQPSRKVRDC